VLASLAVARQLRSELPDGVYHVTARSVAGGELFVDDEDRRAFLWLLGFVVVNGQLECRAYCLMGTHYHLLLEGRRDRLSEGMKCLNGRYARRFNERHDRHGHVFADRYSAYVIKDEAHLEETCRYIAANPVRAGLCESVGDWPWTWIRGTTGQPPPSVPPVRAPLLLSVRRFEVEGET
jgi:REP element-mobilizing transposase RayT